MTSRKIYLKGDVADIIAKKFLDNFDIEEISFRKESFQTTEKRSMSWSLLESLDVDHGRVINKLLEGEGIEQFGKKTIYVTFLMLSGFFVAKNAA